MLLGLVTLVESQSPGFVLTAIVICAVSGWLLAHLLDQAEQATGGVRLWWLAGTAIVSGVGVWTTHFLAMLGYRTDLALGYDVGRTLVSAGAAIIAVGAPLAFSAVLNQPWARAMAGGVSGLGIGVMHLTGMSAIDGCNQSQSILANVAACGVGAAAITLARSLPARVRSPLLATLLIVLAVCGTHFISIAGTVLDGYQASQFMPNVQVGLSLLTAGGTILLILVGFAALAAVRRFEAQELSHAAALTTALQNMSNGILTFSAGGAIEIFNRRLCTLLKLEEDDVRTGMPLATFLANAGRANGWSEERVARVVVNHHAWMAQEGETRVEHNFEDGRVLVIVCQPTADGAVLTYEDVTKARQAQKEISHLAFHDPLTGLANRRSLQVHVEMAFSGPNRFKLLLIDLDRFKAINDTFGHGVGDQLLIQVADRLRAVAGEIGFASRLGGDELALLVYGDAELAMGTAERIIAEVTCPYDLNDVTVVVGCSVGLCCTDDAGSGDELMQRADLALYEAKRQGRGRAVCYRPGMIEAVAERHHMEADLRCALERNEFFLAFQPIMSLADDRIVGFEALLRWKHPTRGLVPPATFIPLAEETGLIMSIGRWVLDQSCREAKHWAVDQHVAVNVSAVQFRSPQLLAHVTAALAMSGLAASRLEIELTETALVEDGPQIAHTLTALRQLGIKIAMDDFGTGFSSLAHLRDLPLDRIKIDRSFVISALTDVHSRAVIKAITQMGRDMSIETLAEGVEEESQLALLRVLGCDAVQGYLIGRPEAPDRTRGRARAA